MPAYRYVEIIAYALLYFIPYILLAYYPFRRELRFSGVLTPICLVGVTALQVAAHFYTAYSAERWWVALLQTFTLALLFVISVRAHWGKSLFTLLMLSNISNFVVCASKCFEGLLFPRLAVDHYRWSNIITLVIAEAMILIPVYVYFRKIYARTLNEVKTSTVWQYIWLVPLTFYSVWFRNFYFSAEGADVLALRPQHLLYTLVINSGALLIYTMIMKLIHEQAINDAYREREVQLMIKQKQFDSLQDRIEEARAARHDLRQHLHMISALLNDRKYDELAAYISRYHTSVSDSGAITYCDHYGINALLQYFAGLAEEHGIAFTANITVPQDIHIPDDVLAVLMGNLLENATEAAMTENKPVITIRGKMEGNAIFFMFINTFTGKTKKAPNGLYLSTKHEGRGIGLRSVRGIVNDYHGMLDIKHEDGLFTVSVLLKAPN